MLRNFFKKFIKNEYPYNVTQQSLKGKNVVFKIFNNIERFRTQQYGGEKDFLEYFLQALRPDDVVYDVGASVGLMTVHAGAQLESGKVYAFEPDKQTCDRLSMNVSLNKLENVDIFQVALGNKNDKDFLYTDGSNGFAPSLKEQFDRTGAPSEKIHVSINKLDSLISDYNLLCPTIIKVDIEGAEFQFIEGADKNLSGKDSLPPRLIFIEIHPQFLSYFGKDLAGFEELISKYNYTCIWENLRASELQRCYEHTP